MPKNAVERLQKLHDELKSVISIYSSSHGENEAAGRETGRKSSAGKNETGSKSLRGIDKSRIDKTVSFIPKYTRLSRPDSLTRKHRTSGKPSSAPSYTSTSSAVSESDYFLEPPTDPKKVSGSKEETIFWTEIVSSQTETRFTGKILWDKFLGKNVPGVRCKVDGYATTDYSEECYMSDTSFEYYQTRNAVNVGPDPKRREKEKCRKCPPKGEKFEDGSKSGSVSSRARSESPRTKTTCEKKIPTSKIITEIKPDKWRRPEEARTRHSIPNKIPRLEKDRSGSRETVCRPKTSSNDKRPKGKEQQEPGNNGRRGNEEVKRSDGASGKVAGTKKDPLKKSTGSSTGSAEKKRPTTSDSGKNSRKLIKSNRPEKSEETEVNELSKIIERSNEKLEKMKVSKNLAMDIAKQLKSKYEEIKNSKSKLLDKLQKVQKDNERLSNEVKNEKELKLELQLSMEEFKLSSKTLLMENDVKARAITEENVYLKEKIREMERIRVDEFIEKQREAERLLKKRLQEQNADTCKPKFADSNKCHAIREESDFRSDDSAPDRKEKEERPSADGLENRAREEDVRRLTREKSKLTTKIEELSNLLSDRQTRVENLEKKMNELEEEVRRQRNHIKEKTERLEETNRELDSIRKNSTNLEEQVKILRKSIEKLDSMHQALENKTEDYENQIKKLDATVVNLKTENESLKTDLENEKDSLLIKNKIIEDQQETINQMRGKSEEFKAAIKRNQSLERLLNIEREEKLELQDAVEHLKWRKEKLKNQIKTLEGDLLLAPEEVLRDLQKTQMVLHELENQVQIKQKEWEVHLQTLIKEKEQAYSVAEIATRKLMQSTNEFQKKSEAQKRLHNILVENFARKEKHQRETEENLPSRTKSNLAQVEANEEMKKINRTIEKYKLFNDKKELELAEDEEIW